MESAVSFAPLRPAGFCQFHGVGQGKDCFLRGGATIPGPETPTEVEIWKC